MLTNKLLKPNRRYHKKGDLRFSTKEYSNPFFNERKKIKNQSVNFEIPLKIKLIFFFLFLLLASTVYVILYSKIFKITQVEINGEGRVNNESIRAISEKIISQKYIKFLPYRNIFLLPKTKLKKELELRYAFDELSIQKDYPNKIVINYKEKSYAFVLEEKGSYFYLDIDGKIIDKANILEVSKQLYPIIKNQTNFLIKDNKTSIDKTQINFILEAFKKFKDLGQEIVIDHFTIDSEINTIKINLENGPLIYLNTNRGVREQIEKLIIVKNEKIKEDFYKKEYIDLRYGDSVYYR